MKLLKTSKIRGRSLAAFLSSYGAAVLAVSVLGAAMPFAAFMSCQTAFT
jgi:hypothetical protein